jgi:hypothetical protein
MGIKQYFGDTYNNFLSTPSYQRVPKKESDNPLQATLQGNQPNKNKKT